MREHGEVNGTVLPMVGGHEEEDECRACGSCVGRREFVLASLGAAVSAILPAALRAAPVGWMSPVADGGPLRYEVPAEGSVQVDRDNEVILVRHEGTIAAFALSCPHQRSMLRWRDNKGIFQCTKHHSEYSPLGEFQKGRATRNMDRLGVQLVDGAVVVDPTRTFHSDEDASGWSGATVAAP